MPLKSRRLSSASQEEPSHAQCVESAQRANEGSLFQSLNGVGGRDCFAPICL